VTSGFYDDILYENVMRQANFSCACAHVKQNENTSNKLLNIARVANARVWGCVRVGSDQAR
jgi:hypothetical protein